MQPQGRPARPTMVQVQMECAACKKTVNVRMTNMPYITNREHSSMILMEHSGQAICDGCGQVVRPAILGIQGIQMLCVPVPDEEQNKVVIPGKVGLI